MSKKVENGIMSILSFENGKKRKRTAEKITIINRLEMNNLVLGKTYMISVTLIDKSTGKPFIDKNKKEVSIKQKIIVEQRKDLLLSFTIDPPDKKTHCLIAKTIIQMEDSGEEVINYDPDNKNTIVIIKSKKKIWILLMLLIIVFFCFFGIYVHTIKNNKYFIPSASGSYSVSDKDKEKKQAEKKSDYPTITFAGYNKASISKDSPSIVLKNPEINKGIGADFVFELKDSETGKLITRTELIKPGKYVYVDLYKHYQSGEHTINLKINPYDKEGQEKNGVTSNIILDVN